MEKIEYKVKEDKDFIGKRYKTYTIEKIITKDNGEKEHRYRVFIPCRDGDINEVDVTKLDFPKPIEQDEWELLPQEYRTAWIKGTMTEELRRYGLSCLQLIREAKKEGVA